MLPFLVALQRVWSPRIWENKQEKIETKHSKEIKSKHEAQAVGRGSEWVPLEDSSSSSGKSDDGENRAISIFFLQLAPKWRTTGKSYCSVYHQFNWIAILRRRTGWTSLDENWRPNQLLMLTSFWNYMLFAPNELPVWLSVENDMSTFNH